MAGSGSLPRPRAVVAAMAEDQASGAIARLVLPRMAHAQFRGAEPGQQVLFGVRDGGRWKVLSKGVIAGPIIREGIGGSGAELACICPLSNAEFYEPPRMPGDFPVPGSSWPESGRTYATRVVPTSDLAPQRLPQAVRVTTC